MNNNVTNSLVFSPRPQVVAPVLGGGLFPVRRIFCVGRNYAAHSREMGGDPERELPFFFSKPADALVLNGADSPYPTATHNLHHEMELVVAVGKEGENLSADNALSYVYGYAAGIDLTRRDIQDEAKAARRPWDMSKGFDASAPIGEIAPSSIIGHPSSGRISLSVNGETKQNSDLSNQIWSVSEIISALSKLVIIVPGDLIFTGTPEGVGPLEIGDTIEGVIDGVGVIRTRIIEHSKI